jgi:hypothetical protein
MKENGDPAERAAPSRMAAFEAVSALKARYFRLMDLKQWDAWQALYVDAAVMDMRGEADAMAQLGIDVGDGADWVLRSAAAIRQSVEGALAGVTTVHHGHMGEMVMTEPGRISATWAMEDIIRYPPNWPLAGFNGYGHYHDSYVLEDGRWLIESVTLKRLLVRPLTHRTQ